MPDDWQENYEIWKQQPDPANLNKVVNGLAPAIGYQLSRMGGHQDPLLQAKARVVAAEAVRTWDPAQGTSLPTWVGHQMTRLHRFRRLNNQILPLPERVQLDAMNIDHSTKKFVDAHGREPDEDELADLTGLTKRRLADVRKGMLVTPGQAALPDFNPAVQTSDHTPEALDAVYGDADRVDRLILEHRMGYNGKPVLPTPELLRRTKLSAPQLARRAGTLARRIHEVTSQLEEVYS